MRILDPGECEPLKAVVHGVLLVGTATCALYNAAAWLKRRERHLAINTVFYLAVTFVERKQVRRHLER